MPIYESLGFGNNLHLNDNKDPLNMSQPLGLGQYQKA